MSKDKIKLIKKARVYPNPAGKDVFLRKYRKKSSASRYTGWDMLRSQIRYIRMPVWIVSLLALIVAVTGLSYDGNVLFAAAAMMPFVSGIAVLESFRAGRFGLSEMEGVTLISGRGILFTRVVCVGIVHIALLLILTVLIDTKEGYGLTMTGSILTIPYLISSVVNMEIERTEFGRKSALPGLAVSALTAISVILAKEQEVIFSYGYRAFWYMLTAALVVMELREIGKMFKMEENYAWNLR